MVSFPSSSPEPPDAWLLREPDPSQDPTRILIVEDEYLVALDIQRGLERMGHIALVAYSGEGALVQIANSPFDLVLMDIKLGGGLDGIDTAAAIRGTRDIPIIYLTAYADNFTLERARPTEPYGYVLKPFQERELKAAIGMALQRHATDREHSKQERLQRFLADTSVRLTGSLDFRAVASDACALLVPDYADWCMLHLDETTDWIPAFTHTAPISDGEPLTDGHSAELIASVLQEGRSEIITHIPDRENLRDCLGSSYMKTLDHIGARSLMCVPLRARGQVLGALALVSGRSRARYKSTDLLWVTDFCQRLAAALDNALLYRKAESAIQMRDDVLAIVSHDLRTPLGTILMQAETLTDRTDLLKVGGQIARSAQRMNRLIGDLLDASALNAGKLALECKTHEIHEIVLEAVDMFRSLAEASGVELNEHIPPEPTFVSCDRDRIVQVLSNLIGNAIKFTPRGGNVDVTARRHDGLVQFEVLDTGRGIAPEQVPHLFDRFWRAKAERHGAGLGLFIARGIVASHGSTLEVETALGKGSRFYFALPEVRP